MHSIDKQVLCQRLRVSCFVTIGSINCDYPAVGMLNVTMRYSSTYSDHAAAISLPSTSITNIPSRPPSSPLTWQIQSPLSSKVTVF